MTETWFPLLVGLVLLVGGGELLVRGAVQAAEKIGITPLVIGLTLVGFGTSMPELVTSVQAGLGGFPGIAFGNVVGSNIANILLIAGVSALIFPIVITRSALRRDAVVMLSVAVAFAVLALLLSMGRVVGASLVALLIGYIWFVIHQERAGPGGGAIHDKSAALAGADPGIASTHRRNGLMVSLLIALAGLVLVVIGGSLTRWCGKIERQQGSAVLLGHFDKHRACWSCPKHPRTFPIA